MTEDIGLRGEIALTVAEVVYGAKATVPSPLELQCADAILALLASRAPLGLGEGELDRIEKHGLINEPYSTERALIAMARGGEGGSCSAERAATPQERRPADGEPSAARPAETFWVVEFNDGKTPCPRYWAGGGHLDKGWVYEIDEAIQYRRREDAVRWSERRFSTGKPVEHKFLPATPTPNETEPQAMVAHQTLHRPNLSEEHAGLVEEIETILRDTLTIQRGTEDGDQTHTITGFSEAADFIRDRLSSALSRTAGEGLGPSVSAGSLRCTPDSPAPSAEEGS